MIRNNYSTVCLFTTLLFIMPGLSVHADEILQRGCMQLVDKVEEFIEKRQGRREIVVGNFSAPPRLRTPGGLAISREVSRAFEQKRFKIHVDAPFQLRGEFAVAAEKAHPNDQFDTASIKVTATLLDGRDEKLANFSIYVVGDSVAVLTGATVDLPANKREAERQAMLVSTLVGHRDDLPPSEQFVPSPPFVDRSEVRASRESLYSVSIWTQKPGGQIDRTKPIDMTLFAPRPAVLKRGAAELAEPIPVGTAYIIHLTNHSDFDAAAKVSIDTLSMFTFASKDMTSNAVIIPPRSSIHVVGWFLNLEKSNLFEVARYEDSEAADQLVPASDVGMVTVTFAAAWEPTASPPPDEMFFGRAKGTTSSTATKRGDEVRQPYRLIPRQIGKTRAVVTIRYGQQ